MDLEWIDEYNEHRAAIIAASQEISNEDYNDAVYDALRWFNSLKPAAKGDVFLYMAGELWR